MLLNCVCTKCVGGGRILIVLNGEKRKLFVCSNILLRDNMNDLRAFDNKSLGCLKDNDTIIKRVFDK